MEEAEELTIEEGGENETQVRRVIDELRSASVSHHNFKQYLRQVAATTQIITSQIENHRLHHRRANREHNKSIDRTGESRLRQMQENNIAPLELYEQSNEARHHLKEMFAWQALQSEIEHILAGKLAQALNVAAQFEVESIVTERITKLHSQMMEQTNKLVTDLISQQNNKIDLIQQTMSKRAELLMENNLLQLREIQRIQMESSREQQIQLIELVKNIMPDTPDVRQVINEAIREFGSTNKRAEQEYEKIQQETTVPKRRREIMERYSEDEDDDEDENPPVKKTPKDSDAVTDPSKSEEKGHVCPVCDEAFGDELQLETHMELQHPDDYA